MRALSLLVLSAAAVLAGCQHGNVRKDPVEGLDFIALPASARGQQDLYIGRGQVIVRAYRGCVAHGSCSKEPLERHHVRAGKEVCTGAGTDGEQALNCVSFDEADVFCKFVRARVPTADEWQRAALRTGRDAILATLTDWTSSGGGGQKEVRTGNWKDADDEQRSWSTGSRPSAGFGAEVGFRCVQDAVP